MKKKILVAGICLLFGLFCTLGCEKKSKEEKAADDVVKKVEKSADEINEETEDFAE